MLVGSIKPENQEHKERLSERKVDASLCSKPFRGLEHIFFRSGFVVLFASIDRLSGLFFLPGNDCAGKKVAKGEKSGETEETTSEPATTTQKGSMGTV